MHFIKLYAVHLNSIGLNPVLLNSLNVFEYSIVQHKKEFSFIQNDVKLAELAGLH